MVRTNASVTLGSGCAWLVAATSAVMACSGSVSRPNNAQLSTSQIVENSKPAIVRIESEAGGEGTGVGTGFFVSSDGRIATNLHVIHGATDIRVTLLDGRKLEVREVLAIDPARDLAIISVRPPQKLPTLDLGDSDNVSAGDPVIAIGNPLGVLDYTVSDGLISSVRPLNRSLTVLQISAPISQGSSGGPLFNQRGQVIGIATAIIGEGQNLNFGIPSNYLQPLLDKGRSEAISVAEFRQLFERLAKEDGDAKPRGRIQRKVPRHSLDIFDDCGDGSIETVVASIGEAIQLGAPLYNQGNHEACFRIYENTAMKIERESGCAGLREALGQGLLRASTLETYTEKAWALRDAFDGVLAIVERKLQGDK